LKISPYSTKNQALRKSFEQSELEGFRLEFSRLCLLVGVVLVMAGVGLDFNTYPERMQQFAGARLMTVGCMLLVYVLLYTDWGKKQVRNLTWLWLFIPQVMICGMVAVTEGGRSVYAMGLHLAVFAAGSLIPFGLLQSSIFSVATLASYTLACWLKVDDFGVRDFLVNAQFLLFTAIISIFCTYFNQKERFSLFCLKTELAEKNDELHSMNKDLAEIKGQLLQQDKMAALGTLAAGLLHEVNNPVNFCLMAVEVGLEDPLVAKSDNLKECLLDAQTGMRRVQQIVSDLKTFAYRGPSEGMSVPFYFDKAFDSARRLSSHELRPIRLNVALDPKTLVRGDEALIIGVLINLLTNAALALVSKGHSDPVIEVTSRWCDGRLHVSVYDNGRGIAPHSLQRIFEPFFTTRDVGKGLGLGLSISYSVIENHGGRLVAESQEGAWTRMSFDLPSGEDHV
jgi:two-component system sensor histidine kinase PhcS